MMYFYYQNLFQGTETVSCHLSLRMTWMEMDWNLKKSDQCLELNGSHLLILPGHS